MAGRPDIPATGGQDTGSLDVPAADGEPSHWEGGRGCPDTNGQMPGRSGGLEVPATATRRVAIICYSLEYERSSDSHLPEPGIRTNRWCEEQSDLHRHMLNLDAFLPSRVDTPAAQFIETVTASYGS